LVEHEKLKHENDELRLTYERLSSNVASYEMHIADEKSRRALLKTSVEQYRHEIELLEERNAMLENLNKELQDEKLQGTGAPVPGSPDISRSAFNLEEELQNTADPTALFQMEIQRLKAENSLLRNNMGVATENERLRAELEELQRSKLRLQTQYHETFEKHAVAQERIKELMNNLTGEA
jgi:protein HOOK3